MKIKVFALNLLILLLSSNLTAQVYDSSTPVLTGKDVSRFIEEYPEMEKEFQKLNIEFDRESNELIVPQDIEVLTKVDAVVKQHGYSDFAEFYTKAAAIIYSYVSVVLNAELAENQPEMAQAIAAIDENPNLTAEQKEQMKETLKQSLVAMQESSEEMAHPIDIATVKPFVPQLRGLFEGEDDE